MAPGPGETPLGPKAPVDLRSLAVWPSRHERAYSSSIMRVFSVLAFAFAALAFPPQAVSGTPVPQGPRSSASGPEQARIGITFGGISFMGLLMEYRWGDRSIELNIGTWTFRDLSASVVGKQYFGPGDFRPFAGVGLWAVLAPARNEDEQTGLAILARAPVGVDWNIDADHHVGAHLSLNRGLWIRRKDPLDDFPPSSRFVPLPGFYYLWNR